MRAGKFDNRISIERRQRTRDTSSGELVEFWSEVATVWAEKLDGKGIRRYAAQQEISEIENGWIVRFDPGLLAITPDGHRIVSGGLVFVLSSVVEIQRRQGVALLGKARAEGLNAMGEAV